METELSRSTPRLRRGPTEFSLYQKRAWKLQEFYAFLLLMGLECHFQPKDSSKNCTNASGFSTWGLLWFYHQRKLPEGAGACGALCLWSMGERTLDKGPTFSVCLSPNLSTGDLIIYFTKVHILWTACLYLTLKYGAEGTTFGKCAWNRSHPLLCPCLPSRSLS